MMSFGITLNRFSIYFRESKLSAVHHGILHETESVGLWIVLLGIGILAWALYRYRRVTREIETDNFTPPHVALNIITIIILILAGTSTIWMITSKG